LTVLDEAAALVDGERHKNYGHPSDDFGRVQKAALALGLRPDASPQHHALYMILVKLSRLVQTPKHHDSIVDIAGYARTYEMLFEDRTDEIY
jgi:hypothetical protein